MDESVFEDDLRALFDHAPSGQGIAGLDGRIEEANPALCALYGYSREELIGRSLWEFIHPDDLEEAQAAAAPLLAGERQGAVNEVRFVRGDGSAIDVEVKVRRLGHADGRPDQLIAVVSDISDRRRAQRESDRRAAEQKALLNLGRLALSATEPSEVLDAACRTVCAVLAVEAVGFSEADLPDTPAPAGNEVGVPVTGAETAYGAFVVNPREGQRLDEDGRRFVDAVANLAAIYLDRHGHETRALHALLHDELTGLPTRKLFLSHVQAVLDRSSSTKATVAVLLIDVDGLKVVNDSLGHACGDELLAGVAARIASGLRRGDTLARVGGDEFAVLCNGLSSADGAAALAERLRSGVAGPFTLGGRPVFATVSIGIALAHGGTAADLLSGADMAMRRAHAAGPDAVEFFDAGMQRQSSARLDLAAGLHEALERDELRVFYQPVLRLSDGAVVGAEALLRWEHPTRGLLGPGEFIGIAEDTGLIVPIGARVLEEACRVAARWPAPADGSPLRVSVNVSARQLWTGSFADVVARALDASGLPPACLVLEITESLLMADVERARQTLGSLKASGVRLSVDDFGTGYSSLARLRRFPVDYLKIDRSFVDGLGVDDDDEAIVTSIVGLAHSMGLAVIAEGVETEEQSQQLRKLRCEAGQGWLWSKAVPEGEFVRWVAACQGRPRPAGAPARAGRREAGPTRVLVVDDDPRQVELVRVLLGAGGYEVIPVVGPGRFVESLMAAAPDLVLMDLRMPGRGGLELIQDVADRGVDLPPVVAVTGHADWLGRPLLGIEHLTGVIAKPIDPEAFVAQVEAFLAGAASV